MRFVDTIFSFVWDISDLFYNAYLEVKDWVWPFYYLQYPLHGLYNTFWSLLTPIAHLSELVDDIINKVADILSEGDIWSILSEPIKWAEKAWIWVNNAWNIVKGWIDDWWRITSLTVQGWIAITTQGLDSLKVALSSFWTITWPELTGKLDSLTAGWDTFRTQTLPTLFDVKYAWEWWKDRFTEVEEWTDSKLKVFLPFRDDLVSLWDSIAEFFSDPEEWLYKAADRIIERFW